MKKGQLPTDLELELLAVLWKLEKATVRDIYDTVKNRRNVGYTTILKFLQIMKEKGLVRRDESTRTHVYEAAEAPSTTRRRLLQHLIARAFGGSKISLMNVLFDSEEPLSRSDFLKVYEQIQRLRDQEAKIENDG